MNKLLSHSSMTKSPSRRKKKMCEKFEEFDQPDEDGYEARLKIPLEKSTSIAHWEIEDFITAWVGKFQNIREIYVINVKYVKKLRISFLNRNST